MDTGDGSATAVRRRGPTVLVLLSSAVLLLITIAVARVVGVASPAMGVPAASTPAATVSAESQRLASSLMGFAGVWQRRDAWLWVFETGEARLRWLTDWCDSTTSTVCDRIDGSHLTIGALAEIRFTGEGGARPPTLYGRVVSMNKEGPFHLGPISLQRLADDIVELDQDTRALVLCRPPQDVNFCDTS